MKKRKNDRNNQAFTLIELIVVIAIMGIILILALPQISRLQSTNKDKKYDAYYSSIESAAKLYMDSQAKDLFGSNSSGLHTDFYQLNQIAAPQPWQAIAQRFGSTGICLTTIYICIKSNIFMKTP